MCITSGTRVIGLHVFDPESIMNYNDLDLDLDSDLSYCLII